jgi:hypothetical protein
VFGALALTPEWHLMSATLAFLSGLSTQWAPLIFALPLLLLTVGASIVQAALGAAHASFADAARSRISQLGLFGVTTLLHLIQPLARLSGRWSYEHPLRWQPAATGLLLPRPRTFAIWSERWRTPEEWLQLVEAALRATGTTPLRGGDYDRWDLEVRGGRLGAARLRIAVEEHGAGRQLLRLRAWPRVAPAGLVVMLLFAALSVGAAFDGASWVASALLGTGAATLALRMPWECAAATHTIVTGVEGYDSLTNLSNIVDQSGSREA